MIGRLAGRLVYKGEDHALVDVGGVGYVVQLAGPTLAALPAPGEAVALWTEMLVREDAITLVGFASLMEREWFRLLVSVQGVGAKSALAVIGALGAEGVSRAIALGDWNAIRAAHGVGPKLAQRVVNELKDRAPAVMAMGAGEAAPLAGAPEEMAPEPASQPSFPKSRPQPPTFATAQAEALSALGNLGYGPSEAARAVAEAAAAEPEADTAALIRAALRLLAPKG
ncbi:Holliday junction DNA helicase subunit RuvA [Meinhardsimonia xiamenensis]|jgi:Holliday junction DNA helicase RuvA|uniref:Holliday junction branch migration complex subunit RuvA n=1 Tax=Meinhardsimonia xiamenensis TaxID=990712 RepID=A0A1G9CIQ0_9RHOB|nr:Holliday junction branch migration protein RuvA [Meinhardsimonia xiamenensis]PRX38348.1 Holliday junction DNA helicase subunit RuvA [Meinhardsimonia xiamenensis]SDK51476.1 Holliday junction DNA helicase subunit RuvA [Meinhardsimonia xiamenensis]